VPAGAGVSGGSIGGTLGVVIAGRPPPGGAGSGSVPMQQHETSNKAMSGFMGSKANAYQ
jgi:hypothetical protein